MSDAASAPNAQPPATLTINGRACTFQPGQNILQVALDHGVEIPHYCYHPSLSVVANCRICLAEVAAPNPRTGKLETIPKLVPTCQTPAAAGQVVRTDTPKSIANQKAVMEYLLINHPVDCPVCDQAGECYLQDYSYQYGRGEARFQEQKIKQPKKDVGPHVLLYSDRCIMCTRCVRFTHEITGTKELMVEGRGAMEQIDVFPGRALDNELSGNVVDLCPVGALLDKDFLFKQRVWLLKRSASVDGLTASGDNLWVEHNDGVVHRVKPRTNLEINRHWITDEVRYGWKFVHADDRLRMPRVRGEEPWPDAEAPLAYEAAYDATLRGLAGAKRIGLLVSPMLSCEDAACLASFAQAAAAQAGAALVLGVGPVPHHGEERTFLDGFRTCTEKAPNARGVRRVLERHGATADFAAFASAMSGCDALIVTGNHPSDWVLPELAAAIPASAFVVLVDTLPTRLVERADVVLPGATWLEKAGSFENRDGRLQAFDRAIAPIDFAKSEAQIALDLLAALEGRRAQPYDPAAVRSRLAEAGLAAFGTLAAPAEAAATVESDMAYVAL